MMEFLFRALVPQTSALTGLRYAPTEIALQRQGLGVKPILHQPHANGTKGTRMARKGPKTATQAATLVLALFGGPATAQTLPPITGHATVQDGDTIIVAGRTVRLQGIDAPEISQSCEDANGKPWRCGADAARWLDRFIAGRIVHCYQDMRDADDRYGRALARCHANGVDIGHLMVIGGIAIAYRRYLDWPDGIGREHKAIYLAAEQQAREQRRGIWQGRFDLPEIWRRAHPR